MSCKLWPKYRNSVSVFGGKFQFRPKLGFGKHWFRSFTSSNAFKKILIGASQTQVKNTEIATFQSFSKGVYGCRFHFAELLSFVDAPLAGSKAACTTLANILLKAHVLNVSVKEKSLGFLRRQDKLSN